MAFPPAGHFAPGGSSVTTTLAEEPAVPLHTKEMVVSPPALTTVTR
jgi:hypothetical protein